MLKYSVIIPAYNAENTIEICLDSIFNQQEENFEVLLINNGSTDNTLEIIEKYKNKYHNINLINLNDNIGPGGARNIGINNAGGEYIIFVDADDFINKKFFSELDKYVDSEIDMVKYNAEYIGDRVEKNIFKTKPFEMRTGLQALRYLIDSEKIFATPWMFIIKRSLFVEKKLYFVENNLHEDYGLIPILLMESEKVIGVEYSGYYYIYHKDSLSTNQAYDQIVKRSFDMLIQYDNLHNYVEENIFDVEFKIKFNGYIQKNLVKKHKKLKGEELDLFCHELEKRKIKIKR